MQSLISHPSVIGSWASPGDFFPSLLMTNFYSSLITNKIYITELVLLSNWLLTFSLGRVGFVPLVMSWMGGVLCSIEALGMETAV